MFLIQMQRKSKAATFNVYLFGGTKYMWIFVGGKEAFIVTYSEPKQNTSRT